MSGRQHQGYRYDSNTSATRQGRVVVNCYLDRNEMYNRKSIKNSDKIVKAYDAGAEDPKLGVDIMDLCFMKISDSRPPQSSSSRDAFKLDDYPHVFSSFNGALVPATKVLPDGVKPGDPLSHEQRKELTLRARDYIKERIVFVGVADQRDDFSAGHDDRHIARTGIPVQTGGVHSIRNTGNHVIKQFDPVCWDMPIPGRQAFKGVDDDKQLASVKPYLFRKDKKREWDSMDMADKHNYDTAKNFFVNDQQRVIGIALSTGYPGGEFDILMGRYSM